MTAPFPPIDGTQPCAQHDPDVFFPDRAGPAQTQLTDRARALCAPCPFRRPCLDYALDYLVDGIWGATTKRQRDRMRTDLEITGEPLTGLGKLPSAPQPPAGARTAAPLDGPALAARHRAGESVLQLAAALSTHHLRISAALREQGVVLVQGRTRRTPTTSGTTSGAGGGDPESATPPPALTPPPPPAAPAGIDPAAVRRLERRRLSNAQIAAELGVPLPELLAHFAAATRPRS